MLVSDLATQFEAQIVAVGDCLLDSKKSDQLDKMSIDDLDCLEICHQSIEVSERSAAGAGEERRHLSGRATVKCSGGATLSWRWRHNAVTGKVAVVPGTVESTFDLCSRSGRPCSPYRKQLVLASWLNGLAAWRDLLVSYDSRRSRVQHGGLVEWESQCKVRLEHAHEHDCFAALVELATEQLPYRKVAFGLEMPLSAAEPSFSFYSNYPEDWRDRFITRRVGKSHGSRMAYLKRTVPIEDENDSNYYSWFPEEFWIEARHHGISFDHFHTGPAGHGTMATIGFAQAAGPIDYLARRRSEILINVFLARMVDLLMRKNLPVFDVKITDRERRYLLWVLDGKSAGDIADIMEEKESAIDHMRKRLNLIFEKSSIQSSAFLAYRLGLLINPRKA